MKIDDYIEKLSSYIEERDFKGYDPYDALNSPLAGILTFNRKLLRIVMTQLFRKCPINLRPLFLIPRDLNPKGAGLFLWGYTKRYSINGEQHYRDSMHRMLRRLEACRSPGYKAYCWGYHFPWQSRAAYLPRFTPTIVNTSFIGHALLDAFLATKDSSFLNMASRTQDFFLENLRRKNEGAAFCFSYTPLDDNYVHNANLLGSSFLARLAKILSNNHVLETALKSLAYSMNHQNDDGSWYYAETSFQRWIDSFHTGFNLQALSIFRRLGMADVYENAYVKGINFYASNFFLEDGTPKYYHDRIYPIDIHSAAQAIVFFSGAGRSYMELTDRIVEWMIKNMWDSSGYFYFRKGRYFTNKIAYMRWSLAWSFHALTAYELMKKAPERIPVG